MGILKKGFLGEIKRDACILRLRRLRWYQLLDYQRERRIGLCLPELGQLMGDTVPWGYSMQLEKMKI